MIPFENPTSTYSNNNKYSNAIIINSSVLYAKFSPTRGRSGGGGGGGGGLGVHEVGSYLLLYAFILNTSGIGY